MSTMKIPTTTAELNRWQELQSAHTMVEIKGTRIVNETHGEPKYVEVEVLFSAPEFSDVTSFAKTDELMNIAMKKAINRGLTDVALNSTTGARLCDENGKPIGDPNGGVIGSVIPPEHVNNPRKYAKVLFRFTGK